MKNLLLIVTAFLSTQAFAGGRLSLQMNQYNQKLDVFPVVGLSIDQNLLQNVYLTGWAGVGSRPVLTETKRWAGGKLGAEFRFADFNLGAGIFANSAGAAPADALAFADGDALESGAYIKASLKLW
jgi:hypothetical protein